MDEPQPKRASYSEIIRALLNRGSVEHSSVTLARNSKGETQIEVIVRTGESELVATIADAEQIATETYDRLLDKYAFLGAPARPSA